MKSSENIEMLCEKHLKDAATSSLDELKLLSVLKSTLLKNRSVSAEKEMLSHAHSLASRISASDTLFSVAIATSALNLLIAASLAKEMSTSRRCVALVSNISHISE